MESWGSPLKLKGFCPFSRKEGPKVKDLSDSSPSVRGTTSPYFWSVEGQPPSPPMPRSASVMFVVLVICAWHIHL